MAAIRIRGTWILTLGTHENKNTNKPRSLGAAQLKVLSANRAGLTGELEIAGQKMAIKGRVKPGSPAVVTFQEDGVADGLQAILYIPPWWPNVDYQYDFITGTLVVGEASALSSKDLRDCLVSVTGVQPFN
jgi:hypothetical protein